MNTGRSKRMRAYWDERARLNAAWYVDTTLDFDQPDMVRFFASGEAIVQQHYVEGLAHPARAVLAVEIGCGLGRICRALSRHFDRVIGIDISAEMVAQARALVSDDGIEFVVNDGADLSPIADGSADLVFSFTVFQHIPDATVVFGYLREAARVLAPGGVLAFQWNNERNAVWWRARRGLLSLLQRTGVRREAYGRHAPEFLGSRISRQRMERVLAASGLDLVGIVGEGTLFCWAYVVRPRDAR